VQNAVPLGVCGSKAGRSRGLDAFARHDDCGS
jgi:hypothetical protein